MVAQRSLELEEELALAQAGSFAPELLLRAGAIAARRGFYARYGKRALDLALGVPLLLLASLVVLVLALLVLASSGWPPFYRARRVGRGGREFSMWKLRSMVRDADQALARWREENPSLAAEYAQNFKLKDDPRVTRLGRFLRRSSLDELPQLWNVVRGDMSLVGPRPIVAEELKFYRESAGEFLSLRPGMTGLWAVSGRNQVEYPQRTWFELSYCRGYSFLGDLRLLARTALVALRMNGL